MVTKVLLTGASGYLGGTVLTAILKSASPEVKNVQLSALVRSESQAEWLQTQNIKPILFSDFSDADNLEKAASDHDGWMPSIHPVKYWY